MDTAIETLRLDVAALGDLIQARFEANLGVSGYIWEARHAAQVELTRLRQAKIEADKNRL